jgi:hypothetical protein
MAPLGPPSSSSASIFTAQPLNQPFSRPKPRLTAETTGSWAVNLRRVREIRPAAEGGWEVKLDPPVNRVLPVSRRRVSALWECFAE